MKLKIFLRCDLNNAQKKKFYIFFINDSDAIGFRVVFKLVFETRKNRPYADTGKPYRDNIGFIDNSENFRISGENIFYR